jgi:ABC-type transporter Mla subunit MlaD
MFGSVQSKTKPTEKVNSVRRAKPEPVGRDRLKHLDAETKKAKDSVSDFEQRVHRLEQIIDAAHAHAALQQAIAADGGVSLEGFATGQAPADSAIAQLVMTAENSARAATAARAALPTAIASLENVNMQVIVLDEERAAELNRVIAMLADEEARGYQRIFDQLGRAHDRLVGYASVAETNLGDIRLIIDPLKAPRFASPSLGNSDADPFIRHQPNPLDIGSAARMWEAVRARLDQDPGADISELLKGTTK